MQRPRRGPALKMKEIASYAQGWVYEDYIPIQQVRRYGKLIPEKLPQGELLKGILTLREGGVPSFKLVNHGIATYMRERALRTPATPPGMENPPKYLYRMGDFTELDTTGKQREKGFIATTRDDIAGIRITVREIPAGTPWIWFFGPEEYTRNGKPYGRWYNKPHFESDEEEVLLPPGTFYSKWRHSYAQLWRLLNNNRSSQKRKRGE